LPWHKEKCVPWNVPSPPNGDTVAYLIVRSRHLVVAVISIALALVVALDVVATVRLMRSDAYSVKQKVAQCLFVWAFPLLGAIVVLSVLNPPPEPERNRQSDMSPVRDDLWLIARSDVDTPTHGGSDGSSHGD
jgi:hypothetical protein